MKACFFKINFMQNTLIIPDRIKPNPNIKIIINLYSFKFIPFKNKFWFNKDSLKVGPLKIKLSKGITNVNDKNSTSPETTDATMQRFIFAPFVDFIVFNIDLILSNTVK